MAIPRIITLSLLVLVVLLSGVFSPAAQANDIYLSQAAAGTGAGTDCSNTNAVSFFNTSSNWGAGASQIGPGTTVHLCGTITTALTFQASGTNGSPITLFFEPNAKISLPFCQGGSGGGAGCVEGSGLQWIVVDGGTNGIIENTANGTNLGNKVDAHGVDFAPGSNIIVRNLTIQNLYKTNCCNDGNSFGTAVFFYGGANVHIYNIMCTGDFGCVNFQFGNGVAASNNEIDHLSMPNSDVAWGIVYAGGDGASHSSSDSIHDNDVTPGAGTNPGSGNSWCTGTSDLNHLDPIHTWSGAGGSNAGLSGQLIYNNYIHGNFCVVQGTANSTAAIYNDTNSGNVDSTAIFNNLVVMTAGHPGDGGFFINGPGTVLVANNTIDCMGNAGGIGSEYGQGGSLHVTYTNNIIMNCSNNAFLSDNAGSVTFASSHNDLFADGSPIPSGDTGSTTVNPKVNADYTLSAVSTLISFGSNLSTQGIAALNVGKPTAVGFGNVGAIGVPRPQSGNWDVGAYAFPRTQPNPPINVSAVPH